MFRGGGGWRFCWLACPEAVEITCQEGAAVPSAVYSGSKPWLRPAKALGCAQVPKHFILPYLIPWVAELFKFSEGDTVCIPKHTLYNIHSKV